MSSRFRCVNASSVKARFSLVPSLRLPWRVPRSAAVLVVFTALMLAFGAFMFQRMK